MADPLSIAASVAGLLSLGIQVSESFLKFYAAYKNQDDNITRILKKLESLLTVFRSLQATLGDREFHPGEENLVQSIGDSINDCEEIIQELEDASKKYVKAPASGPRDKIKSATRRVAYPFRVSTLKKLEEDIRDIQVNLGLALTVLNQGDQKAVHDDLIDVKSLLESLREFQASSAIRSWLNAPDATISHNSMCAKRRADTGLWFINGQHYHEWLDRDNSFLWLNGFAGCGKSVLCSTVIQHTFRQKVLKADVGIAFFYFTFSDQFKQDESAMVKALLLQLAGQRKECEDELAALYRSHESGTPHIDALLTSLQIMIQEFGHVYILLDALDECTRYEKREGVLDTLQRFRQWDLPGLHLLVTSRDEPDIRQALSPLVTDDIALKNEEIDNDIRKYIFHELETNQSLRKWQAHRDEIETALTERAQGVFRYVECQFKALQQCPRTKAHLKGCLHSLPRGLDETYERALCNIDEACVEDARRILTLLCFSIKPLTMSELLHAHAIDLENHALDIEDRLLDSEGLNDICVGLIEVVPVPDQEAQVRIAHFSVQEYLVSDRIKKRSAKDFALESTYSHDALHQICLVYLTDPRLYSFKSRTDLLNAYPLAQYAASSWNAHYNKGKRSIPGSEDLILRIFTNEGAFTTWMMLRKFKEKRISEPKVKLIMIQLEECSLWGFESVVNHILDTEIRLGYKIKDLLIDQRFSCCDALQAAASGGHYTMVQSLLDKGADLTITSERYGNALQAAVIKGHHSVAELLLDRGADINSQDGYNGTALQSASRLGRISMIQLLLDRGARVNSSSTRIDGPALQMVSHRGNTPVARLLLEWGADVNAHDEKFGTALQAASNQGHISVVQLLIDYHANVNAQGGLYGTALQAASSNGDLSVVKLLLDRGADVNARGGTLKEVTALQVASAFGYHSVVQLLLERGAYADS